MLLKKTILCILISLSSSILFAQNKDLKLWYKEPANMWEEAVPLGNGRLGMTPDGGVKRDKIVLNDITLWSGSKQDANNYHAYKILPKIRQLIIEGENEEAQALVDKEFVCVGPGSGGEQFGKFQVLGELDIDFDYKSVDNNDLNYTNYYRDLSLNKALASTQYSINGINYKREYFTSFDDDVSIIKLTASKPRSLNLKVSLSRQEKFKTYTNQNDLYMEGQLENGIDGKGMRYFSKVRANLKDGRLSSSSDALIIKDATEVILFVSAATDFKDANFVGTVNKIVEDAETKKYDLQKKNHVRNFQKFYNRAELNLGEGKASKLPTNERLKSFYNHPDDDAALSALFFQFGRYLTISSTRVGLLPPNLQGLWANQINTPWNGDYHLDVNVQMNHWPVEVTNLSEFNLPLAELVKTLVQPGQRTAKAYYNAEGWIAHVITNVWGFTEPGESASWGAANAGSGWLCNNLWDHYAFTNDIDYLRDIYPVLKGSAQFYNSVLIRDPQTGWLVTSPSVSPENAFYLPNGGHANISMGPTIDNQIVRELFNNVITASKLLNVDSDFSVVLEERLKSIPPIGVIGKDGRILEWIEEYKEVDPQHRHISHLYGLYPASLITPKATPDLAEAAKKTLEVKGDDGPGWAITYKMLFWARLNDGNRAFKLLKEVLKPTERTDINYGSGGGVYANLFCAGPPFQIDGNFGATAGIAEMLIQSHEGEINFLPSLPDNWKKFGEVRGLKARGNYTVDFKWKDGKITSYKVLSSKSDKVEVRVNGVLKEIKTTRI